MESSKTSSKSKNLFYTLFLYREQLNSRNPHYMKLAKNKIHLTDGLISKTLQNVSSCSKEELIHANRELAFKRKLKQQIQKVRLLQKSGLGTKV